MAALQNRKKTHSQESCYFPQLFSCFTEKFRDSWESRFVMEVPTGLGLELQCSCCYNNSPKSKLNHATKGHFRMLLFFFLTIAVTKIRLAKKIVSGIPAYFILSSRLLRSHFLPLDSKAHFSPLPRVVKNKHQMSTALGLAAYQSLICSLSQAVLGTAQDLVAEAHPMGQATSPKAT